jgi:hypothetical protein
VQFIPDAGYGSLGGQDFGPLDMAFTVKRSTRPIPRFTYEDVNYYNFRSKVITRTEFEEMTMAFHDDTLNFATQFYHAYTRAMIPITGLETGESDMLEQRGMDFIGNTLRANEIRDAIGANTYAASSGPLFNDRKQIFKEIRLYHLFDNGNRMNVWRFLNPRITSINLDDLDMSNSNEGSELVTLANTTKYNLGQTQRGSYYPLRYNGPSGAQVGPTSTSTNVNGEFTPPLNPVNTMPTTTSGTGNSAVPAISDLSTKFSNPFDAFDFVG